MLRRPGYTNKHGEWISIERYLWDKGIVIALDGINIDDCHGAIALDDFKLNIIGPPDLRGNYLKLIQIDYFHGMTKDLNPVPVCQDDDDRNWRADRIISLSPRSFVGRRIVHFQKLFRKRLNQRRFEQMVKAMIMIAAKAQKPKNVKD